MRIVIDLQGAQGSSRDRGIGRYSMEFALSVARARKDHEVIIALNGMLPETIDTIRHAFERILPAGNVRVWNGLAPAAGNNLSNQNRRRFSKVLRETFMDSLEPDLVHITSMFEGFSDDAVHSVPVGKPYLIASTFYDLIPLANAEVYLDPDPSYKEFYLNIIPDLMNVDLHLAISDYSREEIIGALAVPPERVANVYAGVDAIFRPIKPSADVIGSLRARFNISKPFLMYSGASDERKNHLRLIEAFSQSRFVSDYQLVLVGRVPPETRDRFLEHGQSCGLMNGQIIVTNTVTDEELVALYNSCVLFVFPAWQEGFGLPLLEAMRCGAPVIGSNTSSIPEVIGNPEALFDPFEVISIRDAIDAALGSPAFQKKMARHGVERGATFSWDAVGEKAIQSYEKAFSARALPPIQCGASKGVDYWQQAVEALQPMLPFGNPDIENIASTAQRYLPKNPSNTEIFDIAKAIALNHPLRCGKQLFIDVSELVDRDARTGIQRVVRSILNELMMSAPQGFQIEPVYATVGTPGYRYARTFVNKIFGGIYSPLPDDIIDIKAGDVFIGLDLQHHVVLSQYDTYAELRKNGVEVYFIVYDLLPVLMPKMFPSGAEAIHDQWLTAISQADGVICISRSVADEMVDWLNQHGITRVSPLKIGWFHLGADVQQSMPSKGSLAGAPTLLKALQASPTFLMVGTLEPRKGHLQTLSAFEKLWTEGRDVNLVIVGKHGWNVDRLVKAIKSSPEFGQRLIWLPSVSDEYLEKIYAVSCCLIAASEGEGFGLPLVEAAQQGIPIFARDIPVFRELGGVSAFYFEGSDAATMAKALDVWLEQYKNGEAPESKNMPWLTWKEATAQLMATILNDNWYRKWTGTEGWRYNASHPAMGTSVGDRVGQELHTSGVPGFLLFGPFVSLVPGRYRVRLYGKYDGSGKVHYDVVANQAKTILDQGTIRRFPHWGMILSTDFATDVDLSQVEIRIKVDNLARVCISRLEFFPVSELQGQPIRI